MQDSSKASIGADVCRASGIVQKGNIPRTQRPYNIGGF